MILTIYLESSRVVNRQIVPYFYGRSGFFAFSSIISAILAGKRGKTWKV
ncbi:hypothetical protein [Desulfosporosinus sp. FKA]|nr:hypothetical protein [Desulfosporosinus sp. FKA]